MLVWGGVLVGDGKFRWWLFLEAMFPLVHVGAASLALLAWGLEHLAVVAAVTGSAVVGTVLSSSFCFCVFIPATPATTCVLLLLSRALEVGHRGGRLPGWVSHGGSLMPDPPGWSVHPQWPLGWAMVLLR